VALAWRSGADSLGSLPVGLHRIPGPLLVAAARYTNTPVGAYMELAVGEPARLGMRPGWCITTMVVDSSDARVGGQLNWGFPKEVGSLVWEADGRDCLLRWVERGITVHGRVRSFAFPALIPTRNLQRRGDGPVVVPGRLRGLARLAKVTIEAPSGDPLAPIAGPHRGVHVGSMRFLVRPARHPVGLASSLRAPLRAPEPALSSTAPGD